MEFEGLDISGIIPVVEPVGFDALLLETGDGLLLETGDAMLLES